MTHSVFPYSIPEPRATLLRKQWYGVGDEIPSTNAHEPTRILFRFGKKFLKRGGFDHRHAGTYIDFNKVQVSQNGELLMDYVDLGVAEMKGYEMRKLSSDMRDVLVRIDHLPETPVWEGDTVVFTHDLKRAAHKASQWIIHAIDYTSGSRIACILQRPYEERSSQQEVLTTPGHIDCLNLVERGNLWKMEHGEKMKFPSIEAEARFYQSIGMSRKISQKVPLFKSSIPTFTEYPDKVEFSVAEALSSIRMGRGHEMKLRDKKEMTFVLIEYDNQEFGRRMRAHTLAKFGLVETEEAAA